MIRSLRIALVCAGLCVFSLLGFSQDINPVVEKTTTIESYNGVEYYLHQVAPGHTLYSISRVYAIPIADLVKINPGLSTDLKPGQVIKIPLDPLAAPELNTIKPITFDSTRYFSHRVLKGETLYGLSKKYNTTIKDIYECNDGLPGGLKAGAVVLLPKAQQQPEKTEIISLPSTAVVTEPEKKDDKAVVLPVPTKPVVLETTPDTLTYLSHEVARKETLYGISRRYDISMDEIIKANPELKENKLRRGDVLRIPQRTKAKVITEKPKEVSYIDHRVEKGETTWSISRKYHVSVEDLLAANPKIRSGLKRNRTIRIPVFSVPEQPDLETPVAGEGEEMEAGNTIVKIIPSTEQGCEPALNSQVFHIALMLPLYLSEPVSNAFTDQEPEVVNPSDNSDQDYLQNQSLRFLDFYKGVRLAVDSLAAMGMNVELHVYDIDDTPQKINTVLSDPDLETMNLIIGPLFRKSFTRMASFAKIHNIPIVNPLTQSANVIRNNPNVFKVQVPEEIHLKLIAHSIKKNYPDANLVLIRQNGYQDQARVDMIKDALNGALKDRVLLPNSYLFNLLVEKSYADTSLHDGELYDTIFIENRMFQEEFLKGEVMGFTQFPNKIKDFVYAKDSIYGFTKYASLARKNIYVSLTDDKAFTMEVLSRLNSLKDTFDLAVYTLPGVLDYELETDFLNSLDMHVAGSGMLDFGTDKFNEFEGKYYNMWGHYPVNQVYAALAWDITLYFGSALYHYGEDFVPCLPNHQYESLYLNFFFVGKEGQGYENGFASVYRIFNFHFVPEEKLLFSWDSATSTH